MCQQMLDCGDIDSSFNWDEAFFMERMFDTEDVTADERKNIVYNGNIRINFFENHNLKIGEYERAIKMYDEVLNGHPGHLAAQYCKGLAYKAMGDEALFADAIEKCKKQLETSGMAQEHLKLCPQNFPELTGSLATV